MHEPIAKMRKMWYGKCVHIRIVVQSAILVILKKTIRWCEFYVYNTAEKNGDHNILEILKKYTDMDHRLTQAEIADILKKEYYMEVDRKTVKRNLFNLLDLDCGIDYTEVARTDKNGNDAPSAPTGT